MKSARLAVVIVGGGIALATIATGLRTKTPSTGSERRAVVAYAAAIKPYQRAGGQVVAEEIRPRLADIEVGAVTADQFRLEAAGWKQTMEKVRRQIAAVRAPSRLHRAAALYDQAMRQYQAAIDGFVTAAGSPASQLKAAITAAVPAAQRADATYDHADRLVDAALEAVGAPVVTTP